MISRTGREPIRTVAPKPPPLPRVAHACVPAVQIQARDEVVQLSVAGRWFLDANGEHYRQVLYCPYCGTALDRRLAG